jgi:hypothetical protein
VGARVKYNFSLLGKKGNQAEVPMKHTRTFDCPSNWGFSFIKNPSWKSCCVSIMIA